MPFDRLLADGELLGDILVAAAFDDAGDHLKLTWREAIGLALWNGRRRLHQGVQRRYEVRDSFAADPVVTREHRTERTRQVACNRVFQHDASGSNLQSFD